MTMAKPRIVSLQLKAVMLAVGAPMSLQESLELFKQGSGQTKNIKWPRTRRPANYRISIFFSGSDRLGVFKGVS